MASCWDSALAAEKKGETVGTLIFSIVALLVGVVGALQTWRYHKRQVPNPENPPSGWDLIIFGIFFLLAWSGFWELVILLLQKLNQ